MKFKVIEISGDTLLLHSSLALNEGTEIELEILNMSYTLVVISCINTGNLYTLHCRIKTNIDSLKEAILTRNYDISILESTYLSYQFKAENVMLSLSAANVELKKELEMYESLISITNYLNSHIAEGSSIYKTICDMLLGALGVDYVSYYSTSRKGLLMLRHSNAPNVKHHDMVKNYNMNVLQNNQIALNLDDIIKLDNINGFDKFNYIKSMLCITIKEEHRLHHMVFEHHIFDSFKDNQIKYLSIIRGQLVNFFNTRELYTKLRNNANKDGLTGLYNRPYLLERLNEELEHNRHNYCICMIDVDDFKHCNDTYGHLYGDEILKSISNIFKSNTRKSDIVARYGGEEIICCFINVTDNEAVLARLDYLRTLVTKISIDNNGYSPSVSLGASFGQPDLSIEDVILKADKALYVAKRTGKNKLITR